MSDELVRLFGTSEPPATAEPVTVGALSCRLTAGGLADIRWHGVELIRAVDYPIRDADWGTKPTRTLALHRRETADGLVIDRRFETEDASVGGSARAELFADGRLHVHLRLDIRTDVDLCRAGFTLLHPIAGFAGAPLLIRHPDGDESRTVFPLRIMPAQPATDIAGMRYGGDGVSVDIELSGALFEMEDQRNWSDASYKTYGKTASFPFPYRLERGAVIEQTLTLRCEGMPAAPAARRLAEAIAFADARESLPELALAGDGAADLTAALPEPIDRLRRVVRLDLRQALEEPLPRPAGPVDVELVVTDERSGLEAELTRFAATLAASGNAPEHVVALPAAYLSSYQPDGDWPLGASPADAVAAARRAFPKARIGGGMLTNFTELNRCPPDPASIDYLTHGTSAIVHAADDRSVLQTLETLPHIFRSARALAGGKPYRLGLTAIGMRSNPYGKGLAANPERRRRTMTAEDPRAGALFGAAWMVGAIAASLGAGIALIVPAAVSGPFGLLRPEGGVVPAFHVVRFLATLGGAPRRSPTGLPPGVYAVAAAARNGLSVAVANASAHAKELSLPHAGEIALLDAETAEAGHDPGWLDTAFRRFGGAIVLPPFAVAFLRLADAA